MHFCKKKKKGNKNSLFHKFQNHILFFRSPTPDQNERTFAHGRHSVGSPTTHFQHSDRLHPSQRPEVERKYSEGSRSVTTDNSPLVPPPGYNSAKHRISQPGQPQTTEMATATSTEKQV